MAVPDYQMLMLPLLKSTADGQEHTLAQAADEIAEQFELTPEDRAELLPSGGQFTLYNRVGWARTYMAKAGLLEKIGRGRFRITERGLELLKENPVRINVGLLNRYPEFVSFHKSSSSPGRAPEPVVGHNTNLAQQTPQELLEESYQALREQTASDLLERIQKASPRFFEKLVIDLLVKMGYGGSRADAGQAIGKPGDDGIDGIIKEDRLGLDLVYVQAKRWKDTISRPAIQSFAGSLEGNRARKGVFITTSRFSSDAREYVTRIEKKIILIDGEQLADLSLEFGIGVEPVSTYTIQRIDSDYFEEE